MFKAFPLCWGYFVGQSPDNWNHLLVVRQSAESEVLTQLGRVAGINGHQPRGEKAVCEYLRALVEKQFPSRKRTHFVFHSPHGQTSCGTCLQVHASGPTAEFISLFSSGEMKTNSSHILYIITLTAVIRPLQRRSNCIFINNICILLEI